MPNAETRYADLDAILARLELMGGTPSDEGEGLTELDHGLQCAAELKAMAGADLDLQIAGLVHDIGHGLRHVRDHGWAGADAVRGVLGERVAELVGLHIDAKRYLVTTDAAYRGILSPASIETLALQGGDMSVSELAEFESNAHWRDALRLRRADEAAKTPGRVVPGLEAWRGALHILSTIRGSQPA
jgi:predicted HD phosphohydrolase